MRPSKITTLLVDMIIKAQLAVCPVAKSPRRVLTLYQWLSDGKILYIELWAVR